MSQASMTFGNPFVTVRVSLVDFVTGGTLLGILCLEGLHILD